MYVPQTDACDVPNSATPVSSDQIAAGQATLQALANAVTGANQAFSALIARPDLNSAGMPASSNPGAPVYRPFDHTPVPSSQQNPTRLASWPTMCVGNGGSLAEPTPTTESNVAVPPGKMPPLTLPPVGGPPAPQAKPAPSAPMKLPTTGNVCIDLQKGYVLQSQVSNAQLLDCINKEYFLMGSHGRLTPAQEAWQTANFATLPHVPDQPNVPKYSPSMGLAGVQRGLGWMVSQYWRGR
jgi:hypothetical protein